MNNPDLTFSFGTILAQLARLITIEEAKAGNIASIGNSLYPENATSAERLIRAADNAMCRLIAAGRNNSGLVNAFRF